MSATATKTKYEAIIGLETHCQLNTKSKIFCSCSTEFDSPPNTNVCPVCLGHPGVLPVLNEEVLASAVKMGLALQGQIARYSKFDRKQYFYPDLPKNYQISQFDLPIVEHGKLEIELVDPKTKEATRKTIGITRLHMEEDAGKLVHAGSDRLSGSTHSLVDLIVRVFPCSKLYPNLIYAVGKKPRNMYKNCVVSFVIWALVTVICKKAPYVVTLTFPCGQRGKKNLV